MTNSQGHAVIGVLFLILAGITSAETRGTGREQLGVFLSAIYTITGAAALLAAIVT